MPSANEKLADIGVAQQVRWTRLKNGQARRAKQMLDDADKRIKEWLIKKEANGQEPWTVRQRKQMQASLERLMNQDYNAFEADITNTVKEVAVTAGEWEVATIQKLGVNIASPNPGVLAKAAINKPYNGAVFKDWYADLKTNQIKRAWRSVLTGINTGETTPEIIRRVIGTRKLNYKDGVLETGRRGAEMFVRTSITHAVNAGREAVWEENEDIMQGLRWVSTLDTGTTPMCRERDGKVSRISASDTDWKPPKGTEELSPPNAKPPGHPNCRSIQVAILKDAEELGIKVNKDAPEQTRSALDGDTTPASMNYYDWLKRQPAAIQIEVLGNKRYKLFKEGIDPGKFVDDKGYQLTLEQLRANDPGAFEAAGL